MEAVASNKRVEEARRRGWMQMQINVRLGRLEGGSFCPVASHKSLKNCVLCGMRSINIPSGTDGRFAH